MGEIEWKLQMSLSGTKRHSLLYRGRYGGKGVQMEIHTPVKKSGGFGRQKNSFFIDDDDREFKLEADLIAAVKEAASDG